MLHVYSDFSKAEHRAGYAFIVASFENGIGSVVKSKSKSSNYQGCSITGEILALVSALRTIPSGSVVIAHTDLKHLPRKRPLKTTFTEQWHQLDLQMKRLQVTLTYEHPMFRTNFYQWCHHASRIKSGCQTENPIQLQLSSKELI